MTARMPCKKLTLSPSIMNEANEVVCETTSERLGHGNFSLGAGEAFACTFEMRLNVPTGIYHLSVLVYRHDTQTVFDEWTCVATIYVNSDEDVRGCAHCFPKLIHQEIRSSAPASSVMTAGSPDPD